MISSDEAHYVNFMLNALSGRNPDAYMVEYGECVKRFAGVLRKERPIELKKVYRGIQLDPYQVKAKRQKLYSMEHITYLSFSEEIEVAKVFADMWHPFCEPMLSGFPKYEGYLIEHKPKSEELLFHYTWREVLKAEVYFGEKAMIIEEQKEVMLLQTGKIFDLLPQMKGLSDHKIGERWT